MPASSYPRPDFERTSLRWQSLDGPWHFLFDDDDVGLTSRWAQTGLPQEVAVQAAGAPAAQTESESITQRIAAGTQELYKDNALTASAAGVVQRRRTIRVPYVFQCPASGIDDRGVHEVLWYERDIADLRTAEEKQQGRRLVLRFGAVDYAARVWVNGRLVGGHRGGHVPFQLDVTEAVDAGASSSASSAHRLTVRVYDSAYDLTQPRGKQYWGAKPESIFYTPSGGIWQSVWLEVVPPASIADSTHGTVLQSNDIESGNLRCHVSVLGRRQGQGCSVEVEAGLGGVVVATSDRKHLSKETDSVDLELSMRLSQDQRSKLPASFVASAPLGDERCWRDGVALWTPEHPLLYDITIRLLDAQGNVLDEVKSQTGMRSINWSRGDGLWRLNDRPYFQALCLDQGYWPDTFMTPPGPDGAKADIELAKRMGFNGCRKHQKVEDPLFYYWADKLGYLVWAEMANSYQYSPEYIDRFNQEWTESVRLAINHPSVVTWTPVNESWGYPSLKDNAEQRDHVRALYYLTKTLDPTRSINDNCGWEHVCSDLTTFHDYSDGPDLQKNCASLDLILGPKAGRDLFVGDAKHLPGAPIMCTEFGGVNIAPAKPEGGAADRDWGYTTASDPQDLLARFERLVKAVTEGGHCCAFVYTQLTDIEQEANGLYSFDRKEKLDAAKVKTVIDEALRGFYTRVGSS
ncbi:glycosyl hydrolases family 2, sugar binding domain-containing protein [Hirsutella rhossiliensis]|uniref:Glycosyl hydrolases family 2, sugar binding domain-containing protein n=1 Tax=Hirsutella rhossiliensis TaxID=111463 RepID=A0A9P8MT09_9HYPO|nr:glycosyl hydrolases family 2, sugar binding domain-containing protein [Hirsutella rhossiliensis]KAH0959894.1 glycosyl hydrolases family 2, sugar binding domain-containing protein [Hirsutella rhossiliensis]